MTIDEAIEILSILESRTQNYSTMAKKDALQLGIEALKLYKELRGTTLIGKHYRLPGETEE
jgi:hypothetical protein